MIQKLEVPHRYALRELADCPCSETCLHQLTYRQKVETERFLLLVNPRLCSKNRRCSFYRDSPPVTYARGFTQMQKRMYPGQYDSFKTKLIAQFGRNPYFERRNGTTLISPKEQDFIKQVVRQVGIEAEFAFDGYEQCLHWKDWKKILLKIFFSKGFLK